MRATDIPDARNPFNLLVVHDRKGRTLALNRTGMEVPTHTLNDRTRVRTPVLKNGLTLLSGKKSITGEEQGGRRRIKNSGK